jgi:hypothetical protein
MSISGEHSNEIVVGKPGPVSLVASKHTPHQLHQSVTRCWLAYGRQEVRRGPWHGSLKPP